MADKTNQEQRLEKVMNCLADSLLEISEEEILAEADGAMLEDAERTRALLLDVWTRLDLVNRRLLSLGHTISPQRWHQHGERAYRNHCLTCGLAISLTPAGEIWGNALDGDCPQAERSAVKKRTASAR